MASVLPREQQASYSAIIDGILSSSDLNIISAKAIRKGLQEQVDYDLTPQKAAITDLIMERFDKFSNDTAFGAPVDPAPTTHAADTKPGASLDPAPTTHAADTTSGASIDSASNTYTADTKSEASVDLPTTHATEPQPIPTTKDVVLHPVPTTNGSPLNHTSTNNGVVPEPVVNASPAKSNKRQSPSEDDDDLSDIQETPSPKKMKRTPKKETDEEIAKRMQAELNAGAGRSTRGGGTARKKAVAKKDKKSTKNKSAARIKAADDSDLDSGDDSSPKPEKERTGGFHKPMGLSPALQELLGATQLSRPQTVKQIWAYVKERDLQDPNDKRHIMCDDKLRAVFKTEKVHMFTMNKILAGQLYPIDEV